MPDFVGIPMEYGETVVMNSKKKWIVALVLGLAAGVLHMTYANALKNESRGGKEVEVLVAAVDVIKGDSLKSNNLATRGVPASFVDSRVLRSGDLEQIVGLVPSVDVEAGQMIQWSDFSQRPDPKKEDLAVLVESGQRAMAITVDAPLSMDGLLQPGHRVDIIGTLTKDDKRKEIAVTILQNVKVLATGADLGNKEKKEEKKHFRTVTLSVAIEEAQLLSLAASRGNLSLILRGHQDLRVMEGVPEKEMADIWDAQRRNELQKRPQQKIKSIERLTAR